jgi:alpha-L-fucosidase
LDQRGLIPDKDEQVLRRFGAIVQKTFARDFARGSRAGASHARGNGIEFGPSTVTDGDPATYWTTNDDDLTPELTLEMPQPTTFSVVRLREFLPLGQRIEGFALDQWTNGQWQEFARGSSVGAQRLLRFPRLTTSRLRLRITKAAACPAISEVGLFLEPSLAVFR